MSGLKEEILRLRSEGLKYREIQSETGASLSTISYYCSPAIQKDKIVARTRDKRNRNVAFLQALKASGCVDCKEKYPYFVLDFDHVRGEKVAALSMMTRYATLEALQEEANKCDIVCSNCHRFRTWNRMLKSGGSIEEFDIEHLTPVNQA